MTVKGLSKPIVPIVVDTGRIRFDVPYYYYYSKIQTDTHCCWNYISIWGAKPSVLYLLDDAIIEKRQSNYRALFFHIRKILTRLSILAFSRFFAL